MIPHARTAYISYNPTDVQETPTPVTPSPPRRRPYSWPLSWLSLGVGERVKEAIHRGEPTIPVLIPPQFVPAICRVFYCW